MRVSHSSARVSLPIKFFDQCSNTRTLQFNAFHEPQLRSIWSWRMIGMSLLLKHFNFIYPSYFSILMFLSFWIRSSAVWMPMKLRGYPVSANQFMMFLFLSVVCMIISPCGVMWFVSAKVFVFNYFGNLFLDICACGGVFFFPFELVGFSCSVFF